MRFQHDIRLKALVFCLAAGLLAAGGFLYAAEPTPEELQQQIDAKNKEIQELEVTAAKYRDTIAATQTEANTLKNQIAKINATITKLKNDIKITERQIQRANLEIKSLKVQITDTTAQIGEHQARLRELVRLIALSDQEHPLEILLKNGQLSEFFNRVQSTINLQDEVKGVLDELHALKGDLAHQKSASEAKVAELRRSNERLNDTKTLQVSEQNEKARVLAETQNQEKKYQELLAENERRRQALESEISAFESKLRPTVDLRSLPTGTGILQWPIKTITESYRQCNKTVWVFLTQCFGLTAFARAGAYNGQGHNGVDMRANSATEVYAADNGVVREVGDTDVTCRGASYGKWILVDHSNGLSTLYAHLSLVRVSSGIAVTRGQIIGYAGKTGYATGPHLHLSVLARDDVRVTDGINELKSRSCRGAVFTLPVAPPSAYLNPLDYL